MINLFKLFRQQIIKNEFDENSESCLKAIGYYPEKVIVTLTSQKVFKIDHVERSPRESGVFEYKIYYKDLNLASDFIEQAYEAEKYKREKEERKGINETGCLTVRVSKANDKYRQELDCPNWSNEEDETGYAPCPKNNRGFEQLAPEDNSCFEIVLNMLGYESYQQFCDDHSELSIEETREELQKELLYFYQTSVAEDWEIGREECEV